MIKKINSWDLAMNEITTIDKQNLQDKIYTIRGLQVMLDRDLADLYNVETKNLRFQFGTLENGRGKHRKYLPYVFTEQCVSMLSAVL